MLQNWFIARKGAPGSVLEKRSIFSARLLIIDGNRLSAVWSQRKPICFSCPSPKRYDTAVLSSPSNLPFLTVGYTFEATDVNCVPLLASAVYKNMQHRPKSGEKAID